LTALASDPVVSQVRALVPVDVAAGTADVAAGTADVAAGTYIDFELLLAHGPTRSLDDPNRDTVHTWTVPGISKELQQPQSGMAMPSMRL
jgi:alpha-D-ribose 1-methylphosphonate 5-triphosphate synthase subunit PhnL